MSWSIRLIIAVVIALCVICSASAGEGRWGRRVRGRAIQSAPQQTGYDSHPQYRYDRERLNQYYREMYPKYYGGFHSRTLLNYGYAPGDIGFRGGLTYPGLPW